MLSQSQVCAITTIKAQNYSITHNETFLCYTFIPSLKPYSLPTADMLPIIQFCHFKNII